MRFTTAVVASLIAISVLSPAQVVAQPSCVAGTLSSYRALGAAGCTYGGLTFRDITASAWRSAGPDVSEVTSSVLVTPFLRTLGGFDYVGFAVGPRDGLATSSDEALSGGPVCSSGCYISNASLFISLTVEGSSFTGRVGLGDRTPRSISVTGTDWSLGYFERLLSAYTGGAFAGASREEYGGHYSDTATCYVLENDLQPAFCDAPIIATASPELTRFDGTLQVTALTGYDAPSPDGPHGDGSVSVAGSEFLFGVSAAPATVTPEPATLSLAATGVALLAGWRRRRSSRRA